jgi:hypothetical protein
MNGSGALKRIYGFASGCAVGVGVGCAVGWAVGVGWAADGVVGSGCGFGASSAHAEEADVSEPTISATQCALTLSSG